MLDLLDIIGAFLRKAFGSSKLRLNEEFRTRDNTLVGLGAICAIITLCVFLFGC